MSEDHQKNYTRVKNGRKYSVTFVQNERVILDEKGLRKALTAKVFDSYTDKVLNKKRLEAAMEAEEVDPMTVSKYVSTVKSNPYIRYSEKEVEEV